MLVKLDDLDDDLANHASVVDRHRAHPDVDVDQLEAERRIRGGDTTTPVGSKRLLATERTGGREPTLRDERRPHLEVVGVESEDALEIAGVLGGDPLAGKGVCEVSIEDRRHTSEATAFISHPCGLVISTSPSPDRVRIGDIRFGEHARREEVNCGEPVGRGASESHASQKPLREEPRADGEYEKREGATGSRRPSPHAETGFGEECDATRLWDSDAAADDLCDPTSPSFFGLSPDAWEFWPGTPTVARSSAVPRDSSVRVPGLRSLGLTHEPIQRAPILSQTLAEFWGQRHPDHS